MDDSPARYLIYIIVILLLAGYFAGTEIALASVNKIRMATRAENGDRAAKRVLYVLDNFDNLVLKDVAEAGGYGVVFGNKMTKEEKETFIALLKSEPRRFIAQEVIDFLDIDILDEGKTVPRKADLRAFVLMADEPLVWKSGLTRFSRNPDSFIVNSSQGGGFKDTWVLSQ
jgi:uncharacterized circularly permuted ATP-grasp superfamily protein